MVRVFRWSKIWLVNGAIALSIIACGPASQPPTSTSTAEPTASAPTEPAQPSPSASGAVTPEPTPITLASLPACGDPQTQAEMSQCASQSAKQEDDELNDVYRQLRKAISGSPQEELLIDAQLAWISFRDADCAYAASLFEGGSQEPQVRNDCIARLTRQRTDQLKQYLTSAERGF